MNMLKCSYVFAALSLSLLVACNNDSAKDKEADKGTETTAGEAASAEATSPANQPKSYTATFSPDSALLGKESEMLIKVTGATAIALTDPDGKDNGIEFVVKLQGTNKKQIGSGSSISVSYENARLQLDNGTNIPASTGTDYVRAQPESSSKVESWTFEIPAGAKPTALSLFLDGTRATISTTLK
jgi:hypothetical protein